LPTEIPYAAFPEDAAEDWGKYGNEDAPILGDRELALLSVLFYGDAHDGLIKAISD
jgi:hypothetical protein